LNNIVLGELSLYSVIVISLILLLSATTTVRVLALSENIVNSELETAQNEKLLFPKSMFPQSDAYKGGWAAGFLGQPFKGHHTQDYIYGFLNGTSTYVYNYNDTGGGHNLDWYIGFHNGAAVADDQYQKGGNFNGGGGCCGGHGKEYCLGYKAGYNRDANALG
jgi:hypothetical protein